MTAAQDGLHVRLESAGDIQVVAVRGEIDLGSAERFGEGLRSAMRAGAGPVVVDLCDVSFMDSTGVHLLLNLLRRLTRQRRRLAVACNPSGVRRLFEVTRLDGTFELFETRDDAVASLERQGPLRV